MSHRAELRAIELGGAGEHGAGSGAERNAPPEASAALAYGVSFSQSTHSTGWLPR